MTHLRAVTPRRGAAPWSHRITRLSLRRPDREVTLRVLHRGYAIVGFWASLPKRSWSSNTAAISAGLRRSFRWQIGLDAMPIVGLLSFLIGVVFAYQGADQLRRFGAEIYTVNLLGVAILRELGVLLTAIIIAGRSGSAFTAQIGTMQVNEEIDALRTLGLDPIHVLVLPRVLGLVVTLPLLAVYADFMGLLGGCLMSWAALDLDPSVPSAVAGCGQRMDVLGRYHRRILCHADAPVGCHEGFNSRSAESSGALTTLSVESDLPGDRYRRVFFDPLLPAYLTWRWPLKSSDDVVICVRRINRFGHQTVHDGPTDVRRGESWGRRRLRHWQIGMLRAIVGPASGGVVNRRPA